MDTRDAQILALLLADCRAPMRVIAAELKVSAAAVHKRILVLEETGVVRKYRCLANPQIFGARAIGMFGCSQTPVTRTAVEQLGAHPSVYQVTTGSHNQIYITAVVRDPPELQDVAGLAQALGLVAPSVKTFCFGTSSAPELTALECRIVAMLGYKARRPLADISRRCGVSVREVARRVERLRTHGAIRFTVDLATTVAGGHWSQIELVTTGNEAPEVAVRSAAGLGTLVLWVSRFEETPSEVHAWAWSESTGALQAFLDRLTTRATVRRAVAGLLLSSYDYPVWIHDQLERRAALQGIGNGPV